VLEIVFLAMFLSNQTKAYWVDVGNGRGRCLQSGSSDP
jgi:hypothetical protein